MSHAPMSPQGCRLFAAALVVAVACAADGATHGIRVQVPSRDEGSAGAPTNPALARPAGSSPAKAKGHLRSSSEVPPGKGQLSGRTPGGNGLPGPRPRVLDERRPPVPPPPPPPQTAPPPDWAPPPAWADQSQELEEQLERLADRDALEKQAPSWTVGRRWWWWWVTDEPVYKKERTHNATDLIPTRCSHHGHEEDCARTRGLALMLDSGTRKSHTLAAPTAFVTGRGGGFFFFRGVASPQEQAELAASFFYIYNAIEEAIDTCADVRVKNMDFARLRRAKALQKDMAFFYGTNGTWEGSLLMWHDIAPPTTATNAYLLRLERAMELDKQHLLIAHMYSGYLGTLFGGQVAGVTSLKNDHKRSTQPVSGAMAQAFASTFLPTPAALVPCVHISAVPVCSQIAPPSAINSFTMRSQVMISKMQRSLRTSGMEGKSGKDADGLNFYQFQHIKDKAAFIEDWCTSLGGGRPPGV